MIVYSIAASLFCICLAVTTAMAPLTCAVIIGIMLKNHSYVSRYQVVKGYCSYLHVCIHVYP